MADPLPVLAPASPMRRRLLLGLTLAPPVSCAPILARGLATTVAPVVLGIDLAAEASISATSICIFDASGRMRMVVDAFSSSS